MTKYSSTRSLLTSCRASETLPQTWIAPPGCSRSFAIAPMASSAGSSVVLFHVRSPSVSVRGR